LDWFMLTTNDTSAVENALPNLWGLEASWLPRAASMEVKYSEVQLCPEAARTDSCSATGGRALAVSCTVTFVRTIAPPVRFWIVSPGESGSRNDSDTGGTPTRARASTAVVRFVTGTLKTPSAPLLKEPSGHCVHAKLLAVTCSPGRHRAHVFPSGPYSYDRQGAHSDRTAVHKFAGVHSRGVHDITARDKAPRPCTDSSSGSTQSLCSVGETHDDATNTPVPGVTLTMQHVPCEMHACRDVTLASLHMPASAAHAASSGSAGLEQLLAATGCVPRPHGAQAPPRPA
jgi:hypothetical protein